MKNNVYTRIDGKRENGTRFNRWFVSTATLDMGKMFSGYGRMDLHEGDTVTVIGAARFKVVKDSKAESCCQECSLGLEDMKHFKTLDADKMAALCLMCNCGDSFSDEKGKSIHLEEDKDEERV